MKVHEVIAALQNYPMDADVFCMGEVSEWGFNGEYSEEETFCVERKVSTVERFDSPYSGELCAKIC